MILCEKKFKGAKGTKGQRVIRVVVKKDGDSMEVITAFPANKFKELSALAPLGDTLDVLQEIFNPLHGGELE